MTTARAEAERIAELWCHLYLPYDGLSHPDRVASLAKDIESALLAERRRAIEELAGMAESWAANWRKGGDAVPRESQGDGDGWYRSTISTAEARARVLDAFASQIRSLASPRAEEIGAADVQPISQDRK